MKIKPVPMRLFIAAGILALLLFRVPCAKAELHAGEILVVANTLVKQSEHLARYYMEQRKIPLENLLLLQATENESIPRASYDRALATPIRHALLADSSLRCVVLIYGLPLRIVPDPLNYSEQANMKYLRAEKEKFAAQLEGEHTSAEENLKENLAAAEKKIEQLQKTSQIAAVDSELALVLSDAYRLDGWLPNPHYVGPLQASRQWPSERVPLLVSRLDGPDETVVRRVIDDSLAVEQTGLTGTACFDARWPKPQGYKKLSGYALYDNSLHRAAAQLGKKMPVILDQERDVIPEGVGLPVALYSGWYSLARYVDAFAWLPGSVGYHIASSECTTLKKHKSTVWCKMMLEKGIAATIGPVSEPYVQAFPLPELFFGRLVNDRYTLVESYFLSLPYLSWRMVLIGDPLYRPFKEVGKRLLSQ